MLQSLELQNIKSYTDGLFQFTDKVNIVVGPNASGKTNLLESIHLLCTGSGFKAEADSHMINRSAEWARIDAVFDGIERIVKIKLEPFSKLFILDDLEKKRLSTNTTIPIVLFEPNHMLLLAKEPERRRTYIDIVLKQINPGYNQLLTRYKRVLAQRNRILKQDNIAREQLFVWDLQLSELAGKIVDTRVQYLSDSNKTLSTKYQSVSGNDESLQMEYDSVIDAGQYANNLAQKLSDSFELDKLRGHTGAGPHRDDIKILLDGRDARSNASRGETRSVVLALKITELEHVEQYTGKKPLLLLDDVFSELDGKRRRTLASSLQNYQTFITTTDADVVMEHFTDCNIIPLSQS